jgi:poly(3-hydroxybutyrate) depolymerase
MGRGRTRHRRTGVAVLLTLALVVGAAACSPAPVGPSSRCSTNAVTLTCPYRTTTLIAAGEARQVLWQVPSGTAPANGWPTVIMFQGTGATPALTWAASPVEPFGAYSQTQVVQRLLDNGFAVLTPATHLSGLTFWDTNNPLVPNYHDSNDHALMLRLFDALDAGVFGDASTHSMYATGISSGGYMTSRMAVSYPGRFKALAIASGSYATCLGPVCDVGPIPQDHPPTMFLHGGLDPVVPMLTMDMYRDKLAGNGIETARIVDPIALHRWIQASPGSVLNWFRSHP